MSMTGTAGAAGAAGGEGAAQGAEAQQAAADAGAAAGAAAGQAVATPAAPTTAQTSTTAVDTTGWPQSAIDAHNAAQQNIARLSRERGDERITAKQLAAQQGARRAIAELAAASGIEIPGLEAGEAPTPEQLATQLQGITGERDDATKTAAAMRAALLSILPGDDAAKAEALDYLEYKLSRDTAYQALDPKADGFAATLSASVQSLVGADPRFKLSGTATATGVESLGGASSADTAITPEAFAAMPINERQNLYTNDKATYDRLVSAQPLVR